MKPNPDLPIPNRLTRHALGVLLALLAVNAFAGGWYAMAGAKQVPRTWLQGSPFTSYFIPGLVLFCVVGGSALLAAVAVFRRHRRAAKAAMFAGIVTLVWIIVQVAIIGYVSWLQPTVAVVALLIMLLSRLLRLTAG